MKSTLQAGGLNFAARQCHRFEDSLETKCGFLIGLFRRKVLLVRLLPSSFPFLFRHKTLSRASVGSHGRPEPAASENLVHASRAKTGAELALMQICAELAVTKLFQILFRP